MEGSLLRKDKEVTWSVDKKTRTQEVAYLKNYYKFSFMAYDLVLHDSSGHLTVPSMDYT